MKKIKFFGPTNTRPARLRVWSSDSGYFGGGIPAQEIFCQNWLDFLGKLQRKSIKFILDKNIVYVCEDVDVQKILEES